MFEHYFLDEKISLNTHYYEFRCDERLDPKRKQLVWKRNGKYLRYYKSLDDKGIPFDYVHNHIALLYRIGALVPLDLSKVKSVKTKIRPYSFDSINSSDFRLFDHVSEWEPSAIFTAMKSVYQISGNVYNIVKNCERAGKYLFNEKLHIAEPLICFDIISAYSSVMIERGVQTGTCEIIHTKEQLAQCNSAFLLINILSVGKHRRYDVIEDLKPGVTFVRHIDLQDLVQYNKIEYEIIGGIGFKGPRDYGLTPYIMDLFAKKEAATSGDSPENHNTKSKKDRELYKSKLNREIYGYCMTKPKATYTATMTMEQIQTLESHNSKKIITYQKQADGSVTALLRKRLTNSYNMANFSVEVSGYARHKLHQYIYKCEDNGIDVFFGFTDSFYIRASDLARFTALFPNAIGTAIGQLKIEKWVEEAYFLKKSVYALKIHREHPLFDKDGNRINYIFSCPEDHKRIAKYGEDRYWDQWQYYYENGKTSRIVDEDSPRVASRDADAAYLADVITNFEQLHRKNVQMNKLNLNELDQIVII